MAKKTSKRLVIDACVARAAGEKDHPVSEASRLFLLQVSTVCHRIVMTAEIEREWDNHQSKFALKWLSMMQSRRKVIRPRSARNAGLRRKIGRSVGGQNERRTMLKDIHLIEAALVTDRTIASNEMACFALFRSVAGSVKEIRRIVVVNPVEQKDEAQEWLAGGAKTVRAWQLRAHK